MKQSNIEGYNGGSAVRPTRCTFHTYEVDGGTWYAPDGTTMANFTYEPLHAGRNLVNVVDVDSFNCSTPIDSADELERIVNE